MADVEAGAINTARTLVCVRCACKNPVAQLLPSICMHIPVPYHADNGVERAKWGLHAVTTWWLRSLICTHTRDYIGV